MPPSFLTPVDRPDHRHNSIQTPEKGQGALPHKVGGSFIKLAKAFFLASHNRCASDAKKRTQHPADHHSKQPLPLGGSQRMRDYRKRMKEKGFIQVRVWVEKKDEELVKYIARFCRDARQKKQIKRVFNMLHLNQKEIGHD